LEALFLRPFFVFQVLSLVVVCVLLLLRGVDHCGGAFVGAEAKCNCFLRNVNIFPLSKKIKMLDEVVISIFPTDQT
jgi:hypothetical protein